MNPEPRYGGLHLRLAAGLIDLLAAQAVFFLIVIVRGMWAGMLDLPLPRRESSIWINVAITWIYFVVFESSARSATPGKMLFRLAVTDGALRRISFPRSAFRFLFKVISACSIAGVLAIPFNRRRRGLHDVLAGTLVVERSALDAPAEGTPASPRRRLYRFLPAAAAAAVLAALALWQYSAWDQERAGQTSCLHGLQEDLAKAKAARRKWDQFQEEVARLEQELDKVRRTLPARLDVESFRGALAEDLSGRGIRVRVSSVGTFRRGRLFRAELQMEAAGDPAAIALVLGRKWCCGGRLTSWKGSYTDTGVRGALSIFATPFPVEPPKPCVSRRSDLWLWPFSTKADRIAREVEHARTELAPLGRERDGVRRYEALKEDLQNRLLFINRILEPGKPRMPRDEPDEPEVPFEGEPRVIRS